MNATEQKAYRWLQNQGYKYITFYSRKSPDFITEDGKGFEVKKARNNVIWFGPRQFSALRELPDITILVFNDGETPIAQIPFSEIADGRKQWHNIRLTGVDNEAESIVLKLEPELKTQIKQEANKNHMSMSDFVRRVLDKWLTRDETDRDRIIW